MVNGRELNLVPELNRIIADKSWDDLTKILKPKLFTNIDGELIATVLLAKVSEILTTDVTNSVIPKSVQILCLKCLGNSCVMGHKHKEYIHKELYTGKYCNNLYQFLSRNEMQDSYPYDTHFPYDGIAQWTGDYVISHYSQKELTTDELEIIRLSIQLLCNLFTFACQNENFPNQYEIPKGLNSAELKSAIIYYTQSKHLPLARASCMFLHNALKNLPKNYFTTEEEITLCSVLATSIRNGFDSAMEIFLFLLQKPNIFREAYEKMSIADKLCLLETFYTEITKPSCQASYCADTSTFDRSVIEFFAERFRKRSDLVLKTVDTYLDGTEPTEIVILLDILGAITSGNIGIYNFINNDKSLLINCTYLLKSVQTLGKQSQNVFTPMQKLSDLAPAAHGVIIRDQSSTDPHSHPAFGFKAGLIRVVGNMSHKNKMCQDLFREMDGIPLLLDCCNIDARNPLIMQWTILALRNLCEGSPENQKIIAECTKVGVVESSVLKEMGLTLHEEQDGKKIGILPFPRQN